jgi:hypothetical protein
MAGKAAASIEIDAWRRSVRAAPHLLARMRAGTLQKYLAGKPGVPKDALSLTVNEPDLARESDSLRSSQGPLLDLAPVTAGAFLCRKPARPLPTR